MVGRYKVAMIIYAFTATVGRISDICDLIDDGVIISTVELVQHVLMIW